MLEAILGNELLTLCALAYPLISAFCPPSQPSFSISPRPHSREHTHTHTCTRSTEDKDHSDLVGIKDWLVREFDIRSGGSVLAGFGADRRGGRLGLGLGSGSGRLGVSVLVVLVMMMELVLDSVNDSHAGYFDDLLNYESIDVKSKRRI